MSYSKRKGETQRHREGKKEKKRARLRGWVRKGEKGVVEVSLWMWSLKMLKCCICCEHPSNGKSMMGRALWRSQGCYIKAEVLHQRFSGSTYWCLFGFVGLLNHFHWFLSLSLLEMLYSFLSCYFFRIYAYRLSTPLSMHERLQRPPPHGGLWKNVFIFYINRILIFYMYHRATWWNKINKPPM